MMTRPRRAKLHVLLQQAVRADQHVDLAFGRFLQRLRLFLRALEARDFGDARRPLVRHLGEAVAEGLVVLFGQQRGRCEDGHLLAVGHRDEGSAQRDLGLAEADVAAHQAVHRPAGGHVADHRVDCAHLVRCFLEAETFGEGVHVVLLEAEGVALACRALCVQRQQFGSRVAHLRGGALLGLFPLAGAELVQMHLVAWRTAVAADLVQLRHRHVQLVAVGVLQMQEFGFALAQVHVGEADVAADAVLQMHHRIADLQFGQIAQEVLGSDLATVALAARTRLRRVELAFGHQREWWRLQHEAFGQRPDGDRQCGFRREHRIEAIARRTGQTVFGEVVDQCFAPACRLGHHHDALCGNERAQAEQRVGRLALDAELGQRTGTGGGVRRAAPHAHDGAVGERYVELLFGQEKLGRRQDGPCAFALHQIEAAFRVAPEVADRVIHFGVERDQCVGRQVVEQGVGVLEEQRNVVLDAGGGHAVRHVLVDDRLRRIAFEGFAEARAEGGACLVVHREFARRQQADFLGREYGALGVDVEGADAFDLVVEQVDAKGQGGAHRIQVDQTAAHAVLARRHNLGHRAVAGHRELQAQAFDVELFALLDEECMGGEVFARRQPVQRGRSRHDQNIQLAAHQRVQRLQPLRHQIVVRRELVVGQGFPVRQLEGAQRRCEPAQLVEQALCVHRPGRDDHQRHTGIAGQAGERKRLCAAGQGRPVDAARRARAGKMVQQGRR
jgi:hypothetical protein